MTPSLRRIVWPLAIGLAVASAVRPTSAQVSRSRVTEERRSIETYPFSEPNPLPILASDPRLYPYHRFEGYAHEPEARQWTVVKLENEWIEVWVLPEVGGKVWGARVKRTGHEFIYRNEVLKFRNIALRGPWTSGGIEFNFGVVGHTPATATPVDYVTRENADGSASVVVGAMDLPSRTHWRVEVRLPADRAFFETHTLWTNPTSSEQPYYNWMTAAAPARDDLVLTVPGNAYLEHPGGRRAWPVDPEGRDLAVYDENRFGGSKSYHVVGTHEDFFGGYYRSSDYGFGHWSRYEDMPGQKIWLWALSRQGGIWEDLLTDADGQYMEFQAGRLFVQYVPSEAVNPISQVGFGPGRTDRWSETWFPIEGLGGLSEASREGALFVERSGDRIRIRAHAFREITDTLRIRVDGLETTNEPVAFEVLDVVERTVIPSDGTARRSRPEGPHVVIELPGLGLRYDSDPDARGLARPFTTELDAPDPIPATTRTIAAAEELVRGRRLADARDLYRQVLEEEPWNREALLGLADLAFRNGEYRDGLRHANKALRLRAYDAEANFIAGNLYRAIDRFLDAREAFGWSARSTAFRSASYVELAELALASGDPAEANRYARLALDYDRHNPSAAEILAIIARIREDDADAAHHRSNLLSVDPLHHFVAAERYLSSTDPADGEAFLDDLRGEYPEQEILELAIAYHGRGRDADALAVLELGMSRWRHPLLRAWAAWLADDESLLTGGADPSFVFPYRPETIAVLEWCAARDAHWSWRSLLALNFWALDRSADAGPIFAALGSDPDAGVFYASRAAFAMANGAAGLDPETDLRRAVALEPERRTAHIPLIRFLQDAGRWQEAISVTEAARRRFPGDFNLALLLARSLNETSRSEAAIRVLDQVQVLPSEHSASSHRLFVEAHTMAALNNLASDPRAAMEHLRTALTWPEHLGQGKPYRPEERLQRFLLGVAIAGIDGTTASGAEWNAVIDGTPAAVLRGDGGTAFRRLDLLGAAALVLLDRVEELRTLAPASDPAMDRVASAIRQASSAPDGLEALGAIIEAAGREPQAFADLEGRMILQALNAAHEALAG